MYFHIQKKTLEDTFSVHDTPSWLAGVKLSPPAVSNLRYECVGAETCRSTDLRWFPWKNSALASCLGDLLGMKSFDPVLHGDYFIIFSKFPTKQPGFNGMSWPFFFCGPEMFFFLFQRRCQEKNGHGVWMIFLKDEWRMRMNQSWFIGFLLFAGLCVCVCSVGRQHVIFHYLKSWQGRFYDCPVQILRNYSCLLIWCVLLFCLTWQVYISLDVFGFHGNAKAKPLYVDVSLLSCWKQ